jgi:hypothetical protein
MAWFNKASDSDLRQSIDLAVSAAREARSSGDREREDGFHNDLDGMIDEANKRGWGRRK